MGVGGRGMRRERENDHKLYATFGMYHLALGKLLTPARSLSNLMK